MDALLKTTRGEEDLLLVLEGNGKLLACKWVDAVQPIERTALDFAADLAAAVGWRPAPNCHSTCRRTWPPIICGAKGPS